MGAENLNIRDLQEFREVDTKKLTIGEFKERLRKLRDKYGMTDQEALKAHKLANEMLPAPNQWV